MTALILAETDSMTGSGKCALELMQQFHEHKACDFILVTQFRNDLNDFCDNIGIANYSFHYALTRSGGGGNLGHFIAVIARPFLNFIAYRKLKRKIDFKKISIIHSNTTAIDFGAYLNKKTGIPHIWHFREFSPFNGAFRMIVKDYIHYVNKYSTKVITVSKSLADFLISKGISKEKVKPIYDGIPALSEKNVRFSKPSNILKMVCVGHIYKQKGQDSIIKALGMLPPDLRKNIHCDFYGPWEETFKQKLDDLISKLDLQNSLSFKGGATNIPTLLKDYDLGIQPSHAEGFSRVTAEYMQAGLCIIAAQEGAIPELIQNRINGLLYTDYNDAELASLIKECLLNKDIIEQLGKQAQLDAEEKFYINKNYTKIVDVYEEISNTKHSLS